LFPLLYEVPPRGTRGIAVRIHNIGTKWNWIAGFLSLPFTFGERDPCTNWIRNGWAPKFVWTL